MSLDGGRRQAPEGETRVGRCAAARHPEGASESEPVGVRVSGESDRMHEPSNGVVHT